MEWLPPNSYKCFDRKWLLLILFAAGSLAFGISACGNKNDEDVKRSSDKESFIMLNDSTWSEDIYQSGDLNIRLIKSSQKYALEINDHGKQHTLDFEEAGIDFKTPEVKWANDNYLCIVTWWSQSFQKMLFIDLHHPAEYKYLDKSIELADSATNNIIYIDSIYADSMQIALESLITGIRRVMSIPIDREKQVYPFYDHLAIINGNIVFDRLGEELILIY